MTDFLEKMNDVQKQQSLAAVKEQLLLEEAMISKDPETIMKAQKYLKDIEERKNYEMKSYTTDPLAFSQSFGYKDRAIQLSFNTLRRMGRTPIIRSIITTRVDQVAAFSQPQENRNSVGFVIRKKRRFGANDIPKEPTKQELTIIDKAIETLLNCGDNGNNWHGDNFDSFLRKTVRDSLELDQMTYEIIRTRKGDPVEFIAVDAATFRLADSYDDNDYEKTMNRYSPIMTGVSYNKSEPINGYYPSYVQVYENRTIADFYPWELCFGIRNHSTNIYANGYGQSELEDLINIVTYLLYSDSYNGRFFSQGSAPKGILKVSGGINSQKLAEFRQQWQATVAGVMNSHKTPIIDAEKMEWVDLQKGNRDMEYTKWQEYLIKLGCAMYKMDPSEIGFPMSSSGAPAMFESNNESRLKYSKDKGLKPLLKFIQFNINKYWTTPKFPGYEFAFVGIDSEGEEKELEMDIKKGGLFMTLKELRRKYNLSEKIDDDDVLLNSIWQQNKQMQAMNQQQGGQQEQQNPFQQYGDEDVEKAEESNPIADAFNNWWEKEITS